MAAQFKNRSEPQDLRRIVLFFNGLLTSYRQRLEMTRIPLGVSFRARWPGRGPQARVSKTEIDSSWHSSPVSLQTKLPADRPALLVSVRDGDEALAALAGGCDILDIKDPTRGALGRASRETVREIISHVRAESCQTPVTVALGELIEWDPSRFDPARELMDGIAACKVGLAGMAGLRTWQTRFEQAVAAIQSSANAPPRMVAVAYADVEQANSPGIEEILDCAVQDSFSGLLVDTWSKAHGRLFDCLPERELSAIIDQCHQAGLWIAMAGRLNFSDVSRLKQWPVDVIAVRSAACLAGERLSRIDTERVRTLRREIASLPDSMTHGQTVMR